MDVITVTSDSLNMMKLGSSEVVHAHEGNGSLDHSVQQDAQADGGIGDGMENPSVPETKIEALSRDQGGTKAPVTISKVYCSKLLDLIKLDAMQLIYLLSCFTVFTYFVVPCYAIDIFSFMVYCILIFC